MSARAGSALRAGLVTLLLGLLCTATFALPELATHLDFGHQHASGAPEHLHPLNLLMGGGLPAVVVSALPSATGRALAVLPLACLYLAEPSPGFLSRAPPGP